MRTTELFEDLNARHQHCLAIIEQLKGLQKEDLLNRPAPNKWNALECVVHLNMYADYYTDEFERRLNKAKSSSSESFISGWLGNYFAKMMLPESEGGTMMKTRKETNPLGQKWEFSEMKKFEHHLLRMSEILKRSMEVNIQKEKNSISIMPFIKLRLGDGLRVVVYHNERHLLQAVRAAASRSI